MRLTVLFSVGDSRKVNSSSQAEMNIQNAHLPDLSGCQDVEIARLTHKQAVLTFWQKTYFAWVLTGFQDATSPHVSRNSRSRRNKSRPYGGERNQLNRFVRLFACRPVFPPIQHSRLQPRHSPNLESELQFLPWRRSPKGGRLVFVSRRGAR